MGAGQLLLKTWCEALSLSSLAVLTTRIVVTARAASLMTNLSFYRQKVVVLFDLAASRRRVLSYEHLVWVVLLLITFRKDLGIG